MQKIKAIEKCAAPNGNTPKARRENDKQWRARFLEVLVHEFEREEQLDKDTIKNDSKREKGEKDEEEPSEFDRRIVIKGEQTVPIDWDSFEMTGDFSEPILTSELYEDIIDKVQAVGNWQANILYKIARSIVQDYYSNMLSMHAVGELFVECYQKCVEKKSQISISKEQKEGILATLYEFFVRVNARKSVAENEREGRNLVKTCGLSWAGTTYYNSDYYYICEKMQNTFQRKCEEITREEHLTDISFDKVEQQTQFLHVGGVTFHSVFVWVQQKDNHPANQYGMRGLKRIPPRNFTFLYRNHFALKEEIGIHLLQNEMKNQGEKERCLWRSFILQDGRDYHNGMSYLLEGKLIDEHDDIIYGEAMFFLQNFILYRVSGCVEFLLVRTDEVN